MILNCEKCDTSFSVPDKALGDKGRKVRCAKCKHVWFQEPENKSEIVEEAAAVPEEKVEDPKSAEDEIVQKVAPAPDAQIIDHEEKEAEVEDQGSKPLIKALAASFIIFALLTMVFISARGALASAVPGLKPVYETFGFMINLPGQDLVFDNMSVDILPLSEAEEDEKLVYQVTGSIINLSLHTTPIPFIKAQFFNKDESVSEPQYIKLKEVEIEGEKVISFSHVLSLPEDKIADPNELRLSFVLKDGA